MDQTDQLVSSPNLTVNFHSETNENTLNTLQNMQTYPINEYHHIECNLMQRNNALYIELHTNFSKRPIVLLVDTGACITLINREIVLGHMQKLNFIVNLFGITGDDKSVTTMGVVHGITAIHSFQLGITLHLIDSKHSGPADGYLGFDFLSQYMAKIDIELQKMILKTKTFLPPEVSNKIIDISKKAQIISNPMPTNSKELDNQDNLIHSLGQNYEFETEQITKQTIGKIEQDFSPKSKQFKSYYKAINTFSRQIHKREDQKIKNLDEIGDEVFTLSEYITEIADDAFAIRNKLDEMDKLNATLNMENNYPDSNYCHMFPIHNNAQSSKVTIELKRYERIFLDLKLSQCSQEEKDYILHVCRSFPSQFYVEGDTLGSTNVLKHKINLIPGAGVVNQRQYRIPHTHKQVLENIIKEYEEMGIIEKCQSNYNSPVILVSKKDANGDPTDFRCVVDYRKLNEISEFTNFPIPLIDDILDSLHGCSYFTTLDIKGAFHQIFMDESSRDYTAFTANNFQYRWVRHLGCLQPLSHGKEP